LSSSIMKYLLALIFVFTLALNACAQKQPEGKPSVTSTTKVDLSKYPKADDKVVKTEEEWKKILSPEAFDVLRKDGTEAPNTGEYVDKKEPGIYLCAGCGNPLFSTDDQFHSGTGWPSFTRPIESGRVIEHKDNSYMMTRTSLTCSRCDGH